MIIMIWFYILNLITIEILKLFLFPYTKKLILLILFKEIQFLNNYCISKNDRIHSCNIDFHFFYH